MDVSFWSSSWIQNLGATVFGGAISTFTSFVVQRQSNKFALEQATKLETSAKRAGALRAMLLLSQAIAEAKSLPDQIQGSIDSARSEDIELTELWQTVGNIFGVGHDQQELPQGDVVFLIEMKEFDLLSQVFLINRKCNIIFEAFKEYQRIRRGAISGIPTVSDGGVLEAGLTLEAAGLFNKHAVEMNTMMAEIMRVLDDLSLVGPQTVLEFGRKAQLFFEDPGFPLVKIVETSHS